MEENKKVRLNKKLVTGWFFAGLICLIITFVCFLFSFNLDTINATGLFKETISGLGGNVPFAQGSKLVEIVTKVMPSLIGIKGIEPLMSNLFWQIIAWVLLGIFGIIFITQIILAIVKKRPSYLIWTLIGIVGFASIFYGYSVFVYLTAGAFGIGELGIPTYIVSANTADNSTGLIYLIGSTLMSYFVSDGKFPGTEIKADWLLVTFTTLMVLAFVILVISVLVVNIYIIVRAAKIKIAKKDSEVLDEDDEYQNIQNNGSDQVNQIRGAANGAPYIVQYFYNGKQGPVNNAEDDATNCCNNTPNAITKEDLYDVLNAILNNKKDAEEKTKENVDFTQTEQKDSAESKDEKVNLIDIALEELDKEFDLVDFDDIKDFISQEITRATNESLEKLEKQRIETETAKATETGEESTIAYSEVDTKEIKERVADKVEVKAEDSIKVVTPIVVALPSNISDNYDEEDDEVNEEELNEDEVRDIIKEEIRNAFADLKETLVTASDEEDEEDEIQIQYVYEDEDSEEIESVKETPKTTETINTEALNENKETAEVVANDIKETKIEETNEEPTPTETVSTEEVETTTTVKESVVAKNEEKPAKKPIIIPQKEIRGKETEIQKGEVIKLPFDEKIVSSEDDIKLAYQTLKSLLSSYGLNSRVSSTGDTFRLAKKTYCKITASGQALKIYLALDPKAYQNSAIPVNDASSKDTYKQIPLGFRVKSDLSLRRARDLIIECMNQNNLVPNKEYVEVDYVAKLKENIKK